MDRSLNLARVALGLALAVACAPVNAAPRRDSTQPYRSLDVLAEVLAYIQNDYVDETTEKDLVQAAVEGMIQRLDPHTMLLRPDVYRAMRDDTSGEFDGVGLEVSPGQDGIVVVTPLADSPAERAGIRAGDRIVSIDGASTRDMSISEATHRMKGAAGTQVTVQVTRPPSTTLQSHVLVRDHVRTTSVDWRILDRGAGTVYVRIRSFQDRTDRELRQALDGARKALGGPIQGLVLDLRNNPGGLLDQAVKVADRFLSRGIIVSTETRGKKPEIEEAHEKDTEPGYPVVLLVNRGSASASEIVAGALQDHGRAVLVGTRTFGKGSVQTVVELEDGSALKLTVARYFTPKHRSIQERGIVPDVSVPEGAPPGSGSASADVEAIGESDLKGHLPNPDPATSGGTTPTGRQEPAERRDVQLDRAVDLLKAAQVFRAGATGTSP